jgi:dynein assembly factor 3
MTPNRTLGSYIPGKKKKTGDSILVRGFWGDIINSPYIPFGVEVAKAEDAEKFFRKINFQRIYMTSDITAYNVQSYIHKIETLKEY